MLKMGGGVGCSRSGASGVDSGDAEEVFDGGGDLEPSEGFLDPLAYR
jgi:hypothetical protein